MSYYVRPPIEVNPSEIVAAMKADMQARVPGWIPHPLAEDTAIIEVVGFQNAITNGQASGTFDNIFAVAGASLFGIEPRGATYAVADSTWTLTAEATALGATIEAGSEVRVQVTATESIGFIVAEDVVVAPDAGVTADGEVPLVALVAGADGSGLTGTALKVTPLDAVASIELDGISQGGQDAEEWEAYLDRMTRRLRRLTFGIVRAEDAEDVARDVDGVARVLVIDNFVPGVNEMQDVSVSATSGTFTLTWSGQTTAAIAYNASAATVQARLEELSNIGVGDVICTLGPLATAAVRVEFANLLGQQNVAAMTHTDSLSGGSAAATVTTVRAGSAEVTNTAKSLTYIAIGSDGLPVASQIKANVAAELEAGRERGFRFYAMDPVYTTVSLTFDFTVYPGEDAAVVKAAAEAAGVAALSPQNHGLKPAGDVALWIAEPFVYYSEIYTALNAVDGLNKALNVRLNGVLDTDVALPGEGGLPLPGTVVGTAV